MREQLKPERSALVARYEFDNRARNSGASVCHYVATLKHLATECKFGEAMRTERLSDRLVSGIRDSKMIIEFLKVKLADLSFDLAVQKCLAIEQASKDVQVLQGETGPGSHNSQKCPFLKERCYHFGIMGHTQQACRKKQATQQTNDPGVNVMDKADSEESDGEYGDLYHVSDSNNRTPISLKVYLEGRPLVMELDTGSAVSVMSKGVYQEYFRHVPLKDTSLKLRTYTGDPV
ncbi:uncharacterized protein [Montipora capricornis]|uniref:uncharacterized protein n=1 Tax=Montipora capricornis TaxID=246305 RepID=UPI0035F17BD5